MVPRSVYAYTYELRPVQAREIATRCSNLADYYGAIVIMIPYLLICYQYVTICNRHAVAHSVAASDEKKDQSAEVGQLVYGRQDGRGCCNELAIQPDTEPATKLIITTNHRKFLQHLTTVYLSL